MINKSVWSKAWEILDPSEKRFAWIVLSIVIATALSAAAMVGSIMPFMTVLSDPSAIERIPSLKALYDRFGFTSVDSFLFALGIGSLGVILIASGTQILRAYAIATFAARQGQSLSTRLFSNYLRQPYAYFLERHTGDMGTQILTFSQQVVDFFFRPAAEIVAAFFSALAVLVLVFWISPFASLVSLAVLGGIYGGTFLVTRRRITLLAREHHEANKTRYRISGEALGGIKTIKVLNRESTYDARFREPSRQIARAQAVTGVTAEVPNYVLQALAFGGIVALALFLLSGIEGNVQDSLGEILPLVGLFAFAGQRLLPEMQRIYGGFTQIQHGKVSVENIYRDLIEEKSVLEKSGPLGSPLRMGQSVMLENVSFQYPNTDKAGLFDFSCQIRAGERVGVIGTTGSGKSTLADVLLGLIPPGSGHLTVDGVQLTSDNVQNWQQSIGYVPQDIFLVDASIRENIALGHDLKEIDNERVNEACRIAQLDAFVHDDLPHGLDSMVGERGVRLSGGQKQRIGLARAVYRDFDLLILDEATSALDNITEKEVMSAINGLPGEKAVFMIAHRLSTVKSCDRILLLDNGRLVADGSWHELIERSELFRELSQGLET